MRTYVTQCRCGHLTTEGDGSSKKLSKKRAAEKMVVEMKKLPPLSPPPATAKQKKSISKPKQTKNLIKATNLSSFYNYSFDFVIYAYMQTVDVAVAHVHI